MTKTTRFQMILIAVMLCCMWPTPGGSLLAGAHETGLGAEEALERLMAGNKRYVGDRLTNQSRADAAARTAVATSQRPFAVILTCSDSRVPPELVFDQGVGELFVVRVAGNIPDPVVVGSIEYAVEHLGVGLVVVLGHERCGAVAATVEAKGKSTGSPNIDAIVNTIKPSVEAARAHCAVCRDGKGCDHKQKEAFIECVIDANARTVAAGLANNSSLLDRLAKAGRLTIVAAKYDLDDGRVTLY